MNLIVNVSNSWAIGKDNNLLFHLSQDMKFFKNKTTGNVIVMGRKTLDSLPGGKALPNRINIVLTNNHEFERENVIVCNSLEELLETLKNYEQDKIFIIGGQAVYNLMLPYCDTAYVTKVKKDADADAFMVNLDKDDNWSVSDCSETFTEKGLDFNFITYKRNRGCSKMHRPHKANETK